MHQITPRHRILLKGIGLVREIYELAAADRRASKDLLSRYGRKATMPFDHPDPWSFLVRSLVRTFFAEVEAVSSGLRAAVFDFHRNGILHLSAAEETVLRELSYHLSKGQVREQPRFFTIVDSLRFRYRLFLRAFECERDMAVSDDRFAAFSRAVELRNKITHPKSTSSLQLTAQDVKDFGIAITWFSEQLGALLDDSLRVVGEPVGL